MELVQEIHQLLMDREETCHRTCFSLQLNGNTLDNFAELKSIEGLSDGATLKVVEEPYTGKKFSKAFYSTNYGNNHIFSYIPFWTMYIEICRLDILEFDY